MNDSSVITCNQRSKKRIGAARRYVAGMFAAIIWFLMLRNIISRYQSGAAVPEIFAELSLYFSFWWQVLLGVIFTLVLFNSKWAYSKRVFGHTVVTSAIIFFFY